jgi:hypothetical protein
VTDLHCQTRETFVDTLCHFRYNNNLQYARSFKRLHINWRSKIGTQKRIHGTALEAVVTEHSIQAGYLITHTLVAIVCCVINNLVDIVIIEMRRNLKKKKNKQHPVFTLHPDFIG